MRDVEARAAALRFTLVAFGVAMALPAQLFIRNGNLIWAIAPLAVAVGCFALASVRRGERPDARPADSDSDLRSSDEPADATARTGAGGFARWMSEDGEFKLGMAMVAAAMVLMFVSLWIFGQREPENLAPAWWCYGAAVILMLVGIPLAEGRWANPAGWFRMGVTLRLDGRALTTALILSGILALAAAIRLYDLDSLPPGLWFDEADNLVHARDYAMDPGRIPVYERSTNLPTMFLLPVAVIVELAGVSITATRLAAAAFGLAGIVAVFLFVRCALGTTAGLIAAFLVAVMRWDIIWSRIGMHGITGVLFGALIGWLTLRAAREGRLSDYACAGAALGLGMWFYAPLRMFPLVVGFILLHHLVVERPPFRAFLTNVVFMGLVALFAAAPVAQVAANEPGEFFARAGDTSVFAHTPNDRWAGQLTESLVEHVRMFNNQGDPNPRHNLPDAPMLDFFTGALFVLGFLLALTRWRDTALFSLPFWVFFMILPGVLTVPWESPQSLRSIVVIPAVAALAAYPLSRLWTLARAAPSSVAGGAGVAAVLAALAVIGYMNAVAYFDDQANDPESFAEFSTDETLMARSRLEQQRRGYSLWVSRQYTSSLTGTLLGGDLRLQKIAAPETLPLDSTQVWLGAAAYFEPRERGFWEVMRAYYPEGEFREVAPPNGDEAMYYAGFVSREALAARQGLDAMYMAADGAEIAGRRDVVSESAWHASYGPPGEYPYVVELSGALLAPEWGVYEFVMDANIEARVELDGRRILWGDKRTARVEVAAGLHSLSVVGEATDAAAFIDVSWKPPDGELEPIPFSRLYRGSVKPMGLAGRFFKVGGDYDSADAGEVTPAMEVFHYNPLMREPHFGYWEGRIRVEQAGMHRFSIETWSGETSLYVDGELVASEPPHGEAGMEGDIFLGEGEYPVRVEYVSTSSGSTRVTVQWGPPGAPLAPIPVDSLTPAKDSMIRVIE